MSRFPSVLAIVAAAVAALALPQASEAVGPSLPALAGGAEIGAPDGSVYSVRLAAGATVLRQRVHGRTVRAAKLPGSWGIQLATLSGAVSGLSPNGRVLVLSDDVGESCCALRTHSRLAVVDTRSLALKTVVALHGDFSVDALSPTGRYLYLIQHVATADATKYKVRAFDLHAGRLLPGTIADRRQAGWLMSGYAIARATARNGAWVYTLYSRNDNYPFIHALDTVHRSAVCIGLPIDWTRATWLSSARLTLSGGTLAVRTKQGTTRFVLDRRTFRVSAP